MSNENVNVTKGWLLSFYNQKIKPYLNGATGSIDDSSTASNKTWSSSKINEKIDTASKHTYSTTEKAVGTWTNGKTIYERTFVNCITIANGSTLVQDYSHGISNIDQIINCFGYTYSGSSSSLNWSFPRAAQNGSKIVYGLLTCSSSIIRFVRTDSSVWNGNVITAVIRYTKS